MFRDRRVPAANEVNERVRCEDGEEEAEADGSGCETSESWSPERNPTADSTDDSSLDPPASQHKTLVGKKTSGTSKTGDGKKTGCTPKTGHDKQTRTGCTPNTSNGKRKRQPDAKSPGATVKGAAKKRRNEVRVMLCSLHVLLFDNKCVCVFVCVSPCTLCASWTSAAPALRRRLRRPAGHTFEHCVG